jgi:hypothetical protein
VAGATLTGCEDRTDVPPAVLEASNNANKAKENLPKPPTTQELLTGHRSRTALVPLPVTMELPPGWGKFNEKNPVGVTIGAGNVLQGYTPNGEVQIQLNPRRAMTRDELDRMVAAAKKEMAEKPQQILKVDLRQHGDVKILERQAVGQPGPLTTYDANNVPHTTTESPFTWTISVLVPNEGAFQVYELNFMGLTKSLYDKDKDFLNSVLNTIQYGEATTPGNPATGPSSVSPATLP